MAFYIFVFVILPFLLLALLGEIGRRPIERTVGQPEKSYREFSIHEWMLENDPTYAEIEEARQKREYDKHTTKDLGPGYVALNGHLFSPDYIRTWEREHGEVFPRPIKRRANQLREHSEGSL